MEDSSTTVRRRQHAVDDVNARLSSASSSTATSTQQQRRPKGKGGSSVVVKHIWPYYIWFEGTFSLAMLEFWEKCLFFAVFTALTLLVSYYAVFHLAANARFIFRRTMYYLFG